MAGGSKSQAEIDAIRAGTLCCVCEVNGTSEIYMGCIHLCGECYARLVDGIAQSNLEKGCSFRRPKKPDVLELDDVSY